MPNNYFPKFPSPGNHEAQCNDISGLISDCFCQSQQDTVSYCVVWYLTNVSIDKNGT